MNTAQRGKRRALVRSSLLALAIAVITILAMQTHAWRGLEERAEGLLASAAGPRAWNPEVVVIEVDEPTLRELHWPIRRDVYADVVQAALQAGARVVAFDIFMVDPSVEPADDLALAGVATAWDRVVLPGECLQQSTAGDPLPDSALPAGPTPAHHCRALSLPVGPLRASAALAQVNAVESPSGYFRGAYLFVESAGRRLPALALAAYARGNGVALADLGQERDRVRVAGRSVAVDREGAVVASYRGNPMEARLSLRWLLSQLAGAAPDQLPQPVVDHLKGKYVLIGQTASSIGDRGPLITGEQLPLVYLHAALLSDFIEGATMRQPADWMSALGVLLVVLLMTAVGLGFRPPIATAITLALLGGLFFGAVWLVGQRWLVSPVAPLLAGIFAFGATLASRLTVQERERQLLRSAFGSYVDPAVLERVLEDPERYLALGGAKKTLSVLFSDIKGYTGLSNELPADQVVQLLREYLDAMTQLVKKHEGRVDKIMGDGILAVFGDPIPHADHAERAVTVGRLMLEEVARMQRRWAGEGKKGIAIRIGVATGEVFVGNIGSASAKIEYTVLGPTVNLASRLEGKAPPGGMLVAEETYQACKSRYSFRAVQGLVLKGFQDAYQGWLFIGEGPEGDPERIAPRLPTQAPVQVRLGEARVPGVVENVSSGGLYVIAEGKVAPGDLVELEFAPVAHLVGSAAVTVKAEVRHVARREDGQQGFGVRIERADAQRPEDLRHFVALYLGPQNELGSYDSGTDTFRVELGDAYGRLIKEGRKPG